jgi:broad-specificity NMP kinase
MHFGGELEREIDVTTRSPADVAEEIKAFVDAAL